ncbi:MAG: MltA domain-containing protein [Alphaproteobacteria bacterium]|nr:MltA domain-containing protein [Alphaproteobacteria bacterium]
MRCEKRFLISFLLLLLPGCALFERPDHFESREITFADLNGWEDDNHAEALLAFSKSCPILARKPRPATSGSGLAVSAATWTTLCAKAAAATSPKQFFEENFTPFQISNNGNDNGLFTGYYEPLLYGSLKKQGDFTYPVYGPPPGFENKKLSLTREQIDGGALAGKGLEIAWVDDPVMLFFTHIQGSGRIRLNNGSEFIAAYAGQNGHPYATLGKLMIDEGLLEKGKVNFFTIRQWLYDHKDQAFAMMQRNPSYVFFKRQESLEVVGAIAAPLTAKRSLAVDNKYIPYGLPLYLETTLPDLPGVPSRPFRRIMIAQDTGGAIKKPVRGDVFFGHGQEAEYLAGFMKQQGRYALLVPKEQ